MDLMWTQLPLELSEHICNQLPKVRKIDEDLRFDIVSQNYMVHRMLKYYTQWFGKDDATYVLLDDLNIITESDYVDVYDAWFNMDTDKRTKYYHSVMM